jgi:uncharacterized cofD-like protein
VTSGPGLRGARVVALGGGHGLAASLAALRTLTGELTAVVTVADDGGSSGRLRRELSVLAPGDLRMALVALTGSGPEHTAWGRVLQHRYPGSGPLGGHAAGNLLLAALEQVLDDPVRALQMAGRLVGLPAGSQVLPMSTVPLDITATMDDGPRRAARQLRGQHAVATAPGRVRGVRLVPPDAPACPQALAALRAADVIVLGPGSLFSSVLPHLLLPDLRSAVLDAGAVRVLVLNLAPQPGETAGFTPEHHVYALREEVPDLRLEVVVADRRAVSDPAGLAEAVGALGARLWLAPVSDPARPAVHDPRLLAVALDEAVRHGGRTGRDRRMAAGPPRIHGQGATAR